MIPALVQDFADVLAALPAAHPRRRLLELLAEAVRRDGQFIARHPTALFQCLWNAGWWYDAPATWRYYEQPAWPRRLGRWLRGRPPAAPEPAGAGLHELLEQWRAGKAARTPGHRWAMSLRPLREPLGTGQWAALRGHTDRVHFVAYLPDGRLLSTSADGTLRTWDADTGAELARLPGVPGVHEAATSADGRLVAIATNHVQVVRLADGAELLHISSDRRFWCVCFSPDGTQVAAGSEDRRAYVWDVADGSPRSRLEGHTDVVTSVAFLPDGAGLLTGSLDGTVRRWDAATGEEITARRHPAGRVIGLAVAPGGGGFAYVQVYGPPAIVTPNGARPLRPREGRADAVGLAFSPDGHRLVTGGADNRVRVWDVPTGGELYTLGAHEETGTGGRAWKLPVAFSTDGGRVVSGSEDQAVRVWPVGPSSRPTFRGPRRKILCLVFSPDGRRLGTGSEDPLVSLWDAETGLLIRQYRGARFGVDSLRFTPSGRRLVGGTWNHVRDEWGELRVWHVATGFQLPAGRWAFVEAADAHPCRARLGELEAVVRDRSGPHPVAWFPIGLPPSERSFGSLYLAAHPDGNTFAGGVGSYLCLFRLEGDPEPGPPDDGPGAAPAGGVPPDP